MQTQDIVNETKEVTDRKKRRFKPGTVALREIKKQQKSVATIIPRAPLVRIVKEKIHSMNPEFRLSYDALDALQ